jgi:hypothetical protein
LSSLEAFASAHFRSASSSERMTDGIGPISSSSLRISCRRCERTVEIQTTDAVVVWERWRADRPLAHNRSGNQRRLSLAGNPVFALLDPESRRSGSPQAPARLPDRAGAAALFLKRLPNRGLVLSRPLTGDRSYRNRLEYTELMFRTIPSIGGNGGTSSQPIFSEEG